MKDITPQVAGLLHYNVTAENNCGQITQSSTRAVNVAQNWIKMYDYNKRITGARSINPTETYVCKPFGCGT